MDHLEHQARILAWYTQLAANPAWKAYAWARVQDLARECPELYGTLPQDLTAAMKERGNADHRL